MQSEKQLLSHKCGSRLKKTNFTLEILSEMKLFALLLSLSMENKSVIDKNSSACMIGEFSCILNQKMSFSSETQFQYPRSDKKEKEYLYKRLAANRGINRHETEMSRFLMLFSSLKNSFSEIRISVKCIEITLCLPELFVKRHRLNLIT